MPAGWECLHFCPARRGKSFNCVAPGEASSEKRGGGNILLNLFILVEIIVRTSTRVGHIFINNLIWGEIYLAILTIQFCPGNKVVTGELM